ncbi:beta-lactamase/transpeptidase-like protein [Schizophyllum amplum]|uniref:Beta-lactamase/transpeptidase-like protein n=1 Tax=Schizophyllum amplum TaxID=97359 RepID=A0A550C102_9AGAR|nr:beta-lactamase/transpeptidase-like protein [Auriculariopsis ampla]
MLRLIALVWHICTVLGAAKSLQDASSRPAEQVLDAVMADFILDTINEWNSPGGVAVAFVRELNDGGWQVETQGYGRAKEDDAPVDENTLFAIASNSKLFTATAAGMLISNTSISPPLSWDTKLASVIPGFATMDPIASAESTITDAMSHRTGIPRHDVGYSSNETVESVMRKLPYLKPSAAFRTTWQYNNIMYTALSYLPSLVLPSKPTIAEYVKTNIFDALDMHDSTYSSRKALSSGRLADGFARQVNDSRDIFEKGITRTIPFFIDTDERGNFNAGAGGVITSAKDMATWLQALLLEGRNPRTNAIVIPAEVLRKVSSGITVQIPTAAYPELGPVVYGGGQRRGTYRGHEYIEHGGSVPGFRTQMTRFPNERFGLAVLVNDDTYGTEIQDAIKWRIVDSFLGLQPINWSDRMKSKLLAEREEKPKLLPRPNDATVPPALEGQYDDAGYGGLLLCWMGAEDVSRQGLKNNQEEPVIILSDPKEAPLRERHPKEDGAASDTADTSECGKLRATAPTVLPGVIDISVPTLLAKWDRLGANYLKLAHYDVGLFNVTMLKSAPTGNASEPFWVAGTDDDPDLANAEFAFDEAGGALGFGLTGGIWGAGAGVPSPQGDTPQARAEVWFTRGA